jgi:3',5'-cyclic AMP phosphodiesterase CpdA
MKIIQLSDLHLTGENDKSLYGIDSYLRFKLALQSIETWHSDAKFIVITGDLTDNGCPKAYEILSEIIKNSKIPIYPILGNHDKRDIFVDYFPDFINDNFVQYVHKIDEKVYIFLDTLVQNHAYGELCSKRIDWLKDKLEKYAKNSIYVFMHHHPIKSGLYEMDTLGEFKSASLFWNLLKKYQNIKHISFGHLHRIMHGVKAGVQLHSTRSTVFQVAYRPDSKVEFLTNEENPTYAVLECMEDDSLRVHHHEFMNEDRLFSGLN